MPRRNSLSARKVGRGNAAFVASAVLGVCVLAAALLVTRLQPVSSVTPMAPVVAEFDTVPLPVPVEPVPAGVRLKDIRFKTVAFPMHQVPEGSVRDLEAYREAVSVAALPAGLPIFAQNLSLHASGSNPVLESIPSGMRAMTVRVDATAAVEGWAGSGSIVDVLLVERERTTVVAERVKILSAERSVVPVEGQTSPNVPSTVTLLVTQDQCLAINTAIPRGRIAFALRGNRDEDAWSDVSFTAAQLDNGINRNSGVDERERVNGFVSVREGDKVRSFALSGGRWIRTEVVPEGTLLGDGQ